MIYRWMRILKQISKIENYFQNRPFLAIFSLFLNDRKIRKINFLQMVWYDISYWSFLAFFGLFSLINDRQKSKVKSQKSNVKMSKCR